jgi:drug/metabolite transporter, DME family
MLRAAMRRAEGSHESPAGDHLAALAARSRSGAVLVVLAAALWSTGGVGVKVASGEPLVIAGLRSLFALLFMAAVIMVRRVPMRDVRGLLKRPLVWGAATSYALMVVCFVLAAKRTTAANAIFIQYTGPVYVALLGGPLLGERATKKDLASVAACVVGMGLAFGGELGGGRTEGNVLAIFSSFGFAGLPLLLRLDQKRLLSVPEGEGRGAERVAAQAPLVAMVLGNAIAAAVSLPAMASHPPQDGKTVVVLLLLGTLQIGLPYVLYGIAVRRLRALESSLLATIEPVLSPIWVVFATGERPSAMALLGGGLIVLAVILQAALRR